jgi:hypothetical protein
MDSIDLEKKPLVIAETQPTKTNEKSVTGEINLVYILGDSPDPSGHHLHEVLLPQNILTLVEPRPSGRVYVPVTLPLPEETEKLCRICHGDDHVHDMIAPCRCSGSVKYVHRSCLDTWRAKGLAHDSFLRCPTCKQCYVLEKQNSEARAKSLYRRRVFRDISLLFFALTSMVCVCIGIMSFCNWFYLSFDPAYITALVDIACGIGLFFAIAGLIGLCIGMISCCRRINPPAHPYNFDCSPM